MVFSLARNSVVGSHHGSHRCLSRLGLVASFSLCSCVIGSKVSLLTCVLGSVAAHMLQPRSLPLEVLFGLLSDSFNAWWLISSVVPVHFAGGQH